MKGKTNRPAWFARRDISPFVLDDSAVNELIAKASHSVVSWVTKGNQPVSAVMLYVLVDDVITVTSTKNHAKYHAWRRNPAASFCIWDPQDIGRQVTLRGQIEIKQDVELLRRFTEGFLTRFGRGTPPSDDRLESEIEKFNAPDRYMMQLHVGKVLSHDLNRLLEVEKNGIDVWD